MIRQLISILGVTMVAFMSVSCGTSKKTWASLESSEWKLVRMDGEEKSEFATENSFTLRFSPADSTISGTAACNRYFGRYEKKGKTHLDIHTGGATRMACPDMNLEQPFFMMLEEIDGFTIDNNRLTLLKQGKERSLFEKNEKKADMHTAENSLDYWGRYEGMLPAADCPGIKTVLELKKENLCSISRTYIDRQAVDTQSGSYTVKGNLLTATFNGSTEYYRLGENTLRKLDNQQQEITGKLAAKYVLKKTEN